MSDEEQLDSGLDEASSDADESVIDDSEIDDEGTLGVGDSASALLAKERERARLQSDIEAFLAGGGKITTVGSDKVNDPPKKPESQYGSQPI